MTQPTNEKKSLRILKIILRIIAFGLIIYFFTLR